MENFECGKMYVSQQEVTAKVASSWYVVPKGQGLVFKRTEKRNAVSNWFIFTWWMTEIKLSEAAAAHVQ